MADGAALEKPPGFRGINLSVPPPRSSPPIRKPPIPSYYQPKRRRQHNCCCQCFCCFLCILLMLILIFLAFFGIFYAWYQPNLPVFLFRPIELERFNVSVKLDGTAVLDSRMVVRLEVNNPNGKMRIYYGETTVSLTGDREIELGSATVPPFRQPANNVALLKFTAALANEVIDSTTGKKLKDR